MGLHLGVTVWHRVGNKHLILLIIKLKIETHHVVGLWFVWVHLVNFYMIRRNIILNVKTTLKPSLLILLMGFLRPKAWFHPVIKQTISFCEIDNINSYHIRKIIRVTHLKVEPLKITVPICIVSDPYIIFDH
jgi:hypothetical protein